MRSFPGPHLARRATADGFTLIELLVALVITLVILGTVFGLILNSLTRYLAARERIEAQQSTRFAADAISKLVRGAGNDPFAIQIATLSPGPGCAPACPPATPSPPPGCPPLCPPPWVVGPLAAFAINPLLHAHPNDNLRVRSDFNPPDGDLDDPLEDIIIHVSGDTLYYRDMNLGGRDEPQFHNIESLAFELFDETGAPTPVADSIRQVRFRITVWSPAWAACMASIPWAPSSARC